MFEVIFLLILALAWIIFASIGDLKKREIANWLNFSLIIFALGFRFFYSLFSENVQGFGFFYQGLIGLGIFFIIGNLLYYGRAFAGGDAKLMMALGAILPFSENFSVNLKIFVFFFLIFLFVGAVYGLLFSISLVSKNFNQFKKQFYKRLKNNKKIIYAVIILTIILSISGFWFSENLLIFSAILIFILPYLYIYAKSIDETCMIEKIKTSGLREGDWLYKNLKIGSKLIKVSWHGLNKEQIKDIRKKYKEIKIRQGIPFTPVFLISFLILIYLYFLNSGLWNSFW